MLSQTRTLQTLRRKFIARGRRAGCAIHAKMRCSELAASQRHRAPVGSELTGPCASRAFGPDRCWPPCSRVRLEGWRTSLPRRHRAQGRVVRESSQLINRHSRHEEASIARSRLIDAVRNTAVLDACTTVSSSESRVP